MESDATLVHALVASCVDYCNALQAGAPKLTIDGRVVTSVERRSSSGQRYKKSERGLSQLLYTELQWLDVIERVAYKLRVIM